MTLGEGEAQRPVGCREVLLPLWRVVAVVQVARDAGGLGPHLELVDGLPIALAVTYVEVEVHHGVGDRLRLGLPDTALEDVGRPVLSH